MSIPYQLEIPSNYVKLYSRAWMCVLFYIHIHLANAITLDVLIIMIVCSVQICELAAVIWLNNCLKRRFIPINQHWEKLNLKWKYQNCCLLSCYPGKTVTFCPLPIILFLFVRLPLKAYDKMLILKLNGNFNEII